MSNASMNKVGCGHFLGLWVSTGVLYFSLEKYPDHRTAIWTGWAVLATAWVLALAIPMAIRYRKQRNSHTDGE